MLDLLKTLLKYSYTEYYLNVYKTSNLLEILMAFNTQGPNHLHKAELEEMEANKANPLEEEIIESVPSEESGSWSAWARSIVLWAAQDPWTFVFNVFYILSPFLLISLYLSYKLSTEIENKKEKRKKKPTKGKKKKKDS